MLKNFPISCKINEKKGFSEFTSPLFFRFCLQNLWVGMLEEGVEELVLYLVDNIEQSDIRCLSVIAER